MLLSTNTLVGMAMVLLLGMASADRGGLRTGNIAVHLRHSGLWADSMRTVGSSAGGTVGDTAHSGAAAGAVVVKTAAAGSTGAVGGSATLESSLSSMVMKMLTGKGPTARDVEKVARDKMDITDAVKRLEGKLPADVQSLVGLAGTTNEKATARAKFSEESLQKARSILNGMVESAWAELDDVVIECKEFDERNRGTFDQVVNDLARLGSAISELSRKKVTANEGISSMDNEHKKVTQNLEDEVHNYYIGHLANVAELKKRKDDLAVFDFILSMTKCGGGPGALVQLNKSMEPATDMRICDDAGELELDFNNPKLQAKFEAMMTPGARQALRAALGQVATGSVGLLQEAPSTTLLVPGNYTVPTLSPTIQPVQEAPDPEGQWKKCTDGKPNCGLLHDTMSLQWGIFKDLVDELTAKIHENEGAFLKTQGNLNEQLRGLNDKKTSHMEMLAEVTSGINTDTEEASEKSDQHRDLEILYKKKMGECRARVEEILFTNMCAVKKVRNEVLAKSAKSPPSKITDCDVQDWVAGECSVPCDDSCPRDDPYKCGGWQTMEREVVVSPNKYGIKCPSVVRQKKCNQKKCPVNCVMSKWSGFSRCTKDCEGGVQMRTRSILIKPKNGGKECDAVQEERVCNTGSCYRDCKLKPWSDWTFCSTACGGGLQERTRSVLVPIRGKGKCPGKKHADRFQEESCNVHDCVGDEVCIAKQDLIIAIDASGSMKQEGFEILRNFAADLTDKYVPKYFGQPAVQVGVIIFGNGHVEPDNTVTPALNIQGLTADLATVKAEIKKVKWQRGLTNMAQAFVLASTMLQQGGRPDAQSAIMVLSDGKYSFEFQTAQKVQELKDKNTQIYMVPVTDVKSKQLKTLKKWASQPWQTNYQKIPGLVALKHNSDKFRQKLIAKFCPDSFSPSTLYMQEEERLYMLIKEQGFPSEDCGAQFRLGIVRSKDECALRAREMGKLAFAWQPDPTGMGVCFVEAIKVTMDTWNKFKADRTDPMCPNGKWLSNPYTDTYILKPVEPSL